MKKADLRRFICEKYSKACFQIRNEWMVNHSSRVIAVYNGEAGGTRNTIVYANKNKVLGHCFEIVSWYLLEGRLTPKMKPIPQRGWIFAVLYAKRAKLGWVFAYDNYTQIAIIVTTIIMREEYRRCRTAN